MGNTSRPFGVVFIRPSEIRMGSPYNHCYIKLVGLSNILLEDAAWQDKCAWGEDNKYLVLIKWNMDNNEPSFHFVIFNTTSGESKESERIFGLVNTLAVKGNTIFYSKFFYTGRNPDGSLSGNSEHQYMFENI